MKEHITAELSQKCQVKPTRGLRRAGDTQIDHCHVWTTLIGAETRNVHHRASWSLPKAVSLAILTGAVCLHAGGAKMSRLRTEVLGVTGELERWQVAFTSL